MIKNKKLIIGFTIMLACTLTPLPMTYTTQAKSKKSVTAQQKISRKKAKKIALKKVPGATITKCYLDYDDGSWKYEIELYKGNYEYDIDIDAYTGSILKYDKDYNDRDDDDSYNDDWDDRDDDDRDDDNWDDRDDDDDWDD